MKTALTELIEKWESEMCSYIPNAPIYKAFIEEAKTFIDKEKQQISNAYENGAFDFQGTNWEYRKETIESKDVEPKDIVKEMDKFGSEGWEVFSLTEKTEQYTRYGDLVTTIYYTLYMKKRVE
jgi:hypothetical protein